MQATPESAGSQDAFIGRPMTTILADDAFVLKMRTELTFRDTDRQRWIEQTLARERELGLHHPAKTWLLVAGEEEPVIANATPRLAPLHQALPAMEAEHGVRVLDALLERYVRTFIEQEIQLDPGLSNFGHDPAGRIFYLDDEMLPARGLVTLAAALTGWLRILPWGDAAVGSQMGRTLKRVLIELMEDPHAAVVIADQLRGAFAADERQKQAQAAIQRELLPRRRRPRPGPRIARPTTTILLADIHANHAALERALEQAATFEAPRLWILGDIVGYGPDPAACLERVRELAEQGAVVIKGNHDHAVALGRRPTRGFSPLAADLVEWTVRQLSREQRDWLLELPAYHHTRDWLAVHGAPQDPTYFNAYIYRMTFSSNLDVLKERGIPYCVHGHTHMAGAYYRAGHRDGALEPGPMDLHQADHWLICPGSVGQTRGGRHGCELAVIDHDTLRVDYLRLAYPIATTIRRLRTEGLPPQLGWRLLQGR